MLGAGAESGPLLRELGPGPAEVDVAWAQVHGIPARGCVRLPCAL